MKRDKEDKELPPEKTEKDKVATSRRGATTQTATPSSGRQITRPTPSSSPCCKYKWDPDGTPPVDIEPPSRPSTATTGKSKNLPPIPRRDNTSNQRPPLNISPVPTTTTTGGVGGEVNVFENVVANKLGVRFEINIVKVQWLPLNGIQFRRSSGDGWQHQMLARRVDGTQVMTMTTRNRVTYL